MEKLLGLHVEPKDLDVLQVCVRGVIVFMVALVMVRVADRRFLSKMSALDVILGFMMASMLARAINGSAPFLPTLVCGFVLVLLHRVLAKLAYRSERIGTLVKGRAEVLLEHGKPKSEALRANAISEADLLEELRLNGSKESTQKIKLATLERSGNISVVPES